jgi:hypothetical protein
MKGGPGQLLDRGADASRIIPRVRRHTSTRREFLQATAVGSKATLGRITPNLLWGQASSSAESKSVPVWASKPLDATYSCRR